MNNQKLTFVFLGKPETDAFLPSNSCFWANINNHFFTVEISTKGYGENLAFAAINPNNNHGGSDQMAYGSWWKSNPLVFSWESNINTVMSKCVKILDKTIRIQIDYGVTNRGTQKKVKKQSKNYFSCNKRVFQCHNQLHMLPCCAIGHCAERMGKKEEFSSEFLHF